MERISAYVETFTKTCKKCGQEKPSTDFRNQAVSPDGKSWRCKSCLNFQAKIYYEKNKQKWSDKWEQTKKDPEKLKIKADRDRKYRQENQDKIRENQRAWDERNRDWVNFKSSEWRRNNPDSIRRVEENRRASKREYYREWRKQDHAKALHKHYTHIRRSKKKKTDLTGMDIFKIIEDSITCPLCGSLLNKKDHLSPLYPNIDHIIPLCQGGDHMKYNVRIVCCLCNIKRPKDGSDI